MKKILFILPFVFAAFLSQAQTETPAQPDIAKLIEFKETDHDFGKIPYGKAVEFDLEMKNISKDSIKIQNVQAGCGCTTPKWQAGPYAAGQTFKITVGFNGYTEGVFNKVVTIYFEGGASKLIKFHGETFKAPENVAPGNKATEKLKGGQQ